MIRMATIVPPQKPEAQTKARLQFLIMAGALGFVLSLVATFFVEARRRRGRRPAGTGPPPARAARAARAKEQKPVTRRPPCA